MASNYRKAEILLELFHILKDAPDGMKPKDAIAKLGNTLTLSEHEKGYYDSGERRFTIITRYATITAAKAGWLIKDNNKWILSQTGLEALDKFNTPQLIHKNLYKQYQKWKKKGVQASDNQDDDSQDSEDNENNASITVTYEVAQEQAQESIDNFLHKMQPYEFQKLVAELLNGMGYHVTWIAPRGKDGGTDLLAYTDPLGIQGPRIKVQVKQQQKSVSEPELKSFMANIGQHDSGIYFCTGGFTSDAEKYARNQENKRIMLVDSVMLVKLWVANMKNLSDQAWQRLPLTPIYFLMHEN